MNATKEKIAIMQAYLDGKELQYRYKGYWKRIIFPSWDWFNFEYRITPQPAREVKLNASLSDAGEVLDYMLGFKDGTKWQRFIDGVSIK